jgi:hypothetical protein
MTKLCKGCEEALPLEDFKFCTRTDGRTYRHPYCDICRTQNNRDYYQQRIADDPNYAIVQSRKSTLAKYGLTPEDYQDLFNLQEGKCAICRRAPDGNGVSKHNLVVDHDHDSGQVRALLCDFCNRGLGIFRDDPELLDEAAKYLRAHRGDQVV